MINQTMSGSSSFSDCEYPGLYTYEPSPFVRYHDNRKSREEITVPKEVQTMKARRDISLKRCKNMASRFQVVMGTDGRLHRVVRREWLKTGRRVLIVSNQYDDQERDLSILQSDAFDDEEEPIETHSLYRIRSGKSIIDEDWPQQ